MSEEFLTVKYYMLVRSLQKHKQLWKNTLWVSLNQRIICIVF